MKYNRFEELPVWKDAIELAVKVFALTSRSQYRRFRSVRDQIERAAMSVSNNIAEGFERGTTQETLTFLYIARGSCGETRSVLCLCERLPAFSDLKSEIRSESERRGCFAAVEGLVQLAPKLRHSRSALLEREEQEGDECKAGA